MKRYGPSETPILVVLFAAIVVLLAFASSGPALELRGLPSNPRFESVSIAAAGLAPAGTGQLRMSSGFTMSYRNVANNADLVTMIARSDFGVILGGLAASTRVASNATTPTALSNGEWWVDCTGTTPTRTCSLRIRDGGATQVIVTSAAF